MHRSWYERFGKRLLDVAMSALGLVALSPALLLIALAVLVDSGRPVFYLQTRIGRDGRPFRLVKFRSMIVGAETRGAGIRVEPKDRRITRVGRVIRRLSLDELPQLWNVLRGEMSVVGPRPGLPYQVEQYDERQRRRLRVRPGLTGWAQVSGRCGIDWARRIELDLEYIETLSLTRDLGIMLRTVPVALRGESMIASTDYWKEVARARRASREGGEDDAPGPAGSRGASRE